MHNYGCCCFFVFFFLLFAGPAANLNFHLLERSFDLIKVAWSVPARIVLYPRDTDVLYYEVQVMQISGDTVLNTSVNGNTTEYLFRAHKTQDYCFLLNICVTPARSARVQETTECIQTSFKRGR